MSFDLSSVLQNVSRMDNGGQDKGREQIEYICISAIQPDQKNFYEISGIEELAANIELCGLQQPIRVRALEDGGYLVVSGHRRLMAIKKLAAEDGEKWKDLPCIVEKSGGSAALNELRLIYANADTRKMSAADIAKQAERVEALLYQLKEEGYEFPGRMRDHVAEACKVSASKLARLKAIRGKLIPEYLEKFNRNALSEAQAYSLSQAETEFQQKLRGSFKKVPQTYYIDTLRRAWENGVRWTPVMNCPDGKACNHAAEAMRHDAGCSNMCKAEKCCLDCEEATRDYYVCKYMCSKAAEWRKDDKAKREADENAKAQKRKDKLQKAVQASAKRIVRAAEAAGLEEDNRFPSATGVISLKRARAYAAGEFGTDYLYRDIFDYGDSPVAAAAKALKCSADYLCGFTEELNPVSAGQPVSRMDTIPWQTGRPSVSGTCLAECRMDAIEFKGFEVCYYDATHGSFCYFQNGDDMDVEVLRWVLIEEK